jgi:hypothetical protein
MKKKYFLFTLLGVGYLANAQGISFSPQTFGGSANICCVADMNGDFLDDIVTVSSTQIKIYSQKTNGGYNSNIYTLPSSVNIADWSIAAGDFDRNGFNDIVLGNGSRVTVLKANTTGTAYSVIAYPQPIFTQRTNFVDINNDGHLDLWACHDVDQSHAYRNDGAGNVNFDISLMPTLDIGGNYATMWSDYDNDGDVDMYLAKCRGGAAVGDPQRINLLYKNNGDGTFTESGAVAGVNDGAQSWSTAIEDFDNDGDFDFLLSNISDQNRMYRNNGDGTFTDIYATTGIAAQVGSWEVQAADFNNDGFVDFFWQNGKELYINNGNMTFTGYDLPFSEGGIGDLNNDGFLDVQMGGNVYYNSGNPNKWLKVQLQGIQSNINGIGARVEIFGVWGKQTREIRSGQGFSHMSTLNAHFGIGTASAITQVVVTWPSGVVDTILNPSSNQTLSVVEGATLAVDSYTNNEFRIYPNPTKDLLNIKFNASETQISSVEIFDMLGRQIMKSDVASENISVQSLNKGTYIILLKDVVGKSYAQKFIKE